MENMLEETVDTSTTQNQDGGTDQDVNSGAIDSGGQSNDNAQTSTQEYEIDGNKYSADAIKQAIEAHTNKENWQKELTLKSQEIAAERKKYADFETETKRLEKTRNLHNYFEEHPELLRRVQEVEKQYFEDVENDPEIKTKIEMTKLNNRIGSLENQIKEKDTELRLVGLAREIDDLKTKEGLSDEDVDVIVKGLRSGYPTVKGAYNALFIDRILQKERQKAEKEVLEKRLAGHEAKKIATGANPAPKTSGIPPLYETWKTTNKGKSFQDYLNAFA